MSLEIPLPQSRALFHLSSWAGLATPSLSGALGRAVAHLLAARDQGWADLTHTMALGDMRPGGLASGSVFQRALALETLAALAAYRADIPDGVLRGELAALMLEKKGFRRALVLHGETPARFSDRADRSVALLFGDAGSATGSPSTPPLTAGSARSVAAGRSTFATTATSSASPAATIGATAPLPNMSPCRSTSSIRCRTA